MNVRGLSVAAVAVAFLLAAKCPPDNTERETPRKPERSLAGTGYEDNRATISLPGIDEATEIDRENKHILPSIAYLAHSGCPESGTTTMTFQAIRDSGSESRVLEVGEFERLIGPEEPQLPEGSFRLGPEDEVLTVSFECPEGWSPEDWRLLKYTVVVLPGEDPKETVIIDPFIRERP